MRLASIALPNSPRSKHVLTSTTPGPVAAVILLISVLTSMFGSSFAYDDSQYARVSEVLFGSSDPAGGDAPNATRGARAIGFVPGEGVSALTASRLQHGTMHLERAGLLPRWSATRSPGIIHRSLSPILEHPAATVDHLLGGVPVKGFIGDLGGQQVAVFVFKQGPFQGQLASSFIPSANQLAKWGL